MNEIIRVKLLESEAFEHDSTYQNRRFARYIIKMFVRFATLIGDKPMQFTTMITRHVKNK